MSAVFGINEIPEELFTTIISCLTLVPVDPEVEKMKKWGKTPRFIEAKEPVIMYTIKEAKIRLPLKFASGLFGKVMNHERPHLQIIKDGIPEFKANLREAQIEPAMSTVGGCV